MNSIRATPFHSRTAEANRLNAWINRNGCTLPAHYGDKSAEAIAARTTAAISDISWRWRLMIDGARAEEFLMRLLTCNPAKLSPGKALKALWLDDAGGVRGAGALARFGRESFLLVSTAADFVWIARAAALFDVRLHEIEGEMGGLAIVGPYARKVLEVAGIERAPEELCFRKVFWRGFDITLSRFGEHGGYEIWCDADDAPIVWTRIAKAGERFAARPAGVEAMDILDLEAGIPRPGRDFEPAQEGFAPAATPRELGLEILVEENHSIFNGRAAYLAYPKTHTRVGVEFDDETPAAHTVLMGKGGPAGRTMSSLYSPALRRAVALAVVNMSVSEPGTLLSALGRSARVSSLPFLPVPDPIAR
jgi:aminomethyltransferase